MKILFPLDNGNFVEFGRYYLPEAAIELEENNHYRAWAADGHLIITDGNMIDMIRIKEDLLELRGQFQINEVAYDPHQATMFVLELMAEGVPCVEYGATVLNFSEPMKQLDALIHARKIRHNGNPVMTWSISNVVAKVDAKDNVYPRKERLENKIDPVVALIMTIGRYMAKPQKGPSIYADPGVQVWPR